MLGVYSNLCSLLLNRFSTVPVLVKNNGSNFRFEAINLDLVIYLNANGNTKFTTRDSEFLFQASKNNLISTFENNRHLIFPTEEYNFDFLTRVLVGYFPPNMLTVKDTEICIQASNKEVLTVKNKIFNVSITDTRGRKYKQKTFKDAIKFLVKEASIGMWTLNNIKNLLKSEGSTLDLDVSTPGVVRLSNKVGNTLEIKRIKDELHYRINNSEKINVIKIYSNFKFVFTELLHKFFDLDIYGITRLMLNKEIYAYRFYTNKGVFDAEAKALRDYNFNDEYADKTEDLILYNKAYLTIEEINTGNYVKDVSKDLSLLKLLEKATKIERGI